MRIFLILPWAGFSLAILSMYPAAAGELRCDTHLITEGASQYDVLRKCGEPVYKETLKIPLIQPDARRTVVYDDQGRPIGTADSSGATVIYKEIQRWTYDPGSGSFLRLLDFDNGVLVRIEMGPRS